MTWGRDTLALNTVLAAVAVLVVAAIMFSGRTVPVISADEIGYLADAQLLAGGSGVNMGYTQFYFGGYAVLLTPLNWLFHDPRSFYRAAVMLNAVFMAATVPVLVRLAADFGFTRSALTPWLAAVLMFWPSQLFQAYLALPEIGLRLIMLLLVAAAFSAVRVGGLRNTMLVGLLAALAYAFHPRSIVVLPVAALLLVTCTIRRSISWIALLVALAIVVAGYLLVGRLNAYLQSALWLHDTTAADSVTALARRIMDEPVAMALRSFGHGWYQAVATLLLVPFGLIAAVTWTARREPGDRRIVSAFVILLTLGIGAAGSSNMIHPATIDWLIYSRFLDVITPALAWIGILAVTQHEWRPKLLRWLPWLTAAALAGGVLLYLRYSNLGMGGPNLVEIGSFAPLARLDEINPDPMARTMLLAPLVLVGVAVTIHLAARREAWLLAGLSAFCLLTTTNIYAFYRGANVGGEKWVAAAAESLAKAGDAPIHMDRSVSGGAIYTQQFMLGRNFPSIDIGAAVPPGGTVVIAGAQALDGLRAECIAALPDNLSLVRIGGPAVASCPN